MPTPSSIYTIPEAREDKLAASLGTGLADALSGLAQQRAQQVQRRNQAGALEALLGLDPQVAQQASYAPESVLKEFTKQHLMAPSREAYASALQSLLQPEGQQAEQESLLGEQQPQQLGKAPAKLKGLTEAQATKLAELGLKQKESQKKEVREAFKFNKEEMKEIVSKARAAKTNLQDLARLEELDKEGKLDTPGYVEFLKRSGFDIPALMNPGSEEYQKITQTFLRDAKTYLGSRISNFELEQFLKTIPSLSQSPEGRKRVVSNLKRINRTALEYNNALKDVIKENKGVPPLDLQSAIEDKVDKKLDKVAEQFKKDLQRPVPAGQNKFITALQAGTGSAIGKAGSLAKGAAGAYTGYKVGKNLGPIGGLAGGALGGLFGLSGLASE